VKYMLKTQTPKIIIDTNLWISFLIGKSFTNLKSLIVEKQIEIIISEQLLTEIRTVTQRPKLTKYFPQQKVEDFLEFLTSIAIKIEITSNVTLCRDPKDNFLLALAKDSKANYLLTGDSDLLILNRFENTEILKYIDFIHQENLQNFST
jgi:putative PIN family toxin of toxin-antitoxin system